MTTLVASVRIDDARRAFAPGETVSGSATLSADAAWKCDYAEVALVWHTEGKGDADRQAVAVESLATKGETTSPSLTRPFVFRMPQLPWTYHGRALKIHWTIGVYAKPAGEAEASAEVPIEIHPRHAPARHSFAGFPVPE